MSQELRIGIIGGGAAGFFSALSVKEHFPNAKVTIYEKSNKLLAKVKISGGGRCNVTNGRLDNKELVQNYPRGEKLLRKGFEQFNAKSTLDWFSKRGVELVTYPENNFCVFPKSNDSQTIIDCFLNEAKRLGIEIQMQTTISDISQKPDKSFQFLANNKSVIADKIIIATGGSPKKEGMQWLEDLGCEIVDPLPSLFTFNMPKESIREFMGVSVENATVRIESQKLTAKGALLITHWGMSGPAILKLSAWGARILAEKKYDFAVLINWLDDVKEEELRLKLKEVAAQHGSKLMTNLNPFPFPSRLWIHFIEKAGISLQCRWKELGSKTSNKLINLLVNDRYVVSGKTTYKEEFVTTGGVALNQIDFQTMESKAVEGMFFAGEVMDIDGITGGFNFQAAWTTAWIAGKSVGDIKIEA